MLICVDAALCSESVPKSSLWSLKVFRKCSGISYLRLRGIATWNSCVNSLATSDWCIEKFTESIESSRTNLTVESLLTPILSIASLNWLIVIPESIGVLSWTTAWILFFLFSSCELRFLSASDYGYINRRSNLVATMLISGGNICLVLNQHELNSGLIAIIRGFTCVELLQITSFDWDVIPIHR